MLVLYAYMSQQVQGVDSGVFRILSTEAEGLGREYWTLTREPWPNGLLPKNATGSRERL